ncbi:Ig-like domain-containing protein [Gordonia sp. CPCC 205515]|uniref:Ig-like domain-containing protein n=1 Tax=Gordonia sp. CPCC 205515 TaxID=3140791 RepID=UPI003AF36BCC
MSTSLIPRRRSRVTAAAATLAAAAGAATLVLAAPASAQATSVSVTPGPGGRIGTTCTYDVVAAVTGPNTVRFKDNGVLIGGGPIAVSGGTATVKWTPTTPGTHIITAQQGTGNGPTRTTTVQVGQGMNFGSMCLVF